MKKALITGITGQDGSYLAEFLIEKGYEVHGIVRRASTFNRERIEPLYLKEVLKDSRKEGHLKLHYGDMTDSSSIERILMLVKPDEIYNLAAQSHVQVSFDVPEYTAETDAVGTLRLLEAVRILGMEKHAEFIRRQHQSCLVRFKRYHRRRPHLFIHVLHMVLLNSMVFGLLRTIVSLMACMLLMVFFLIMSLSAEVKTL